MLWQPGAGSGPRIQCSLMRQRGSDDRAPSACHVSRVSLEPGDNHGALTLVSDKIACLDLPFLNAVLIASVARL